MGWWAGGWDGGGGVGMVVGWGGIMGVDSGMVEGGMVGVIW